MGPNTGWTKFEMGSTKGFIWLRIGFLISGAFVVKTPGKRPCKKRFGRLNWRTLPASFDPAGAADAQAIKPNKMITLCIVRSWFLNS